MRHIPIFTFINKLDREARSPYDLMEQLENEFGIGTYPMNWPIGCGQEFKGVYDREKQEILAFNEFHRGQSRIKGHRVPALTRRRSWTSSSVPGCARPCPTTLSCWNGAGYDFDINEVRKGRLSPVFFGSALNNFGVEPFLESFLKMTMAAPGQDIRGRHCGTHGPGLLRLWCSRYRPT